jgi:filamentous hemagglutinin
MKKLKYITPVLIAIACFGLQQANATTTYTLSNPNGAIAAFPAPYGSVTVNLDATQTIATITFTAAAHGGFQYLFGDGGTAAVNVNGAFTLGPITGTQLSGFTVASYSQGPAGNEDGFGSFNLTINSMGGYTQASNSITFTLTKSSGTWSSAANVLTANANGALVAAHIFVAAFPANAKQGALATGFAANGGAVNTPDGGTTVMLLGAALGVLGMARRYLFS